MYYYANNENNQCGDISFGDLDISLKSIGYFVKVVEYGNISKAAENIFVSQPYLSKSIKGLEERLGFDLFLRERNRLTLTTRGNEFYRTFRPLMYFIHENIEEIKNSDSPKINIAIQNILDIFKICDKGFVSHLFKSEQCNVTYYNSFEIEKGMTDGTIDTAVIIAEYMERFPNYESFPIGQISRAIIVSEENEFSGRESVAFEELLDKQIVFYIEANCEPKVYIDMIEKYCEEHGFNSRNISFAENFQTALFDVTLNKNKLILVEELISNVTQKGLVTIPVENADYNIVAIINKKLSKGKNELINRLYNKMA